MTQQIDWYYPEQTKHWSPEQLKRSPITTPEEVAAAFKAEAIADLANLKPMRITDSALYDRLIFLDMPDEK